MTETNIKIEDEGPERKYFTMVPNFIVDHAGSYIALSLYLNMKRFAGEAGLCYASEKTFMGRLGIGRKALHAAMEDLIEKGWVRFDGHKQISTNGGQQLVKAYAMTDIWKKNVDHYSESQGVSIGVALAKRTPLSEREHLEGQRGALPVTKGVRFQPTKKNPNTKKNNSTGEAPAGENDHKDIVEVIDAFKPVNPSFGRWYANKNQRLSIRRIIASQGKETVLKVIAILPKTNHIPYLPTVTTPSQLEEKWAALAAGLAREKQKIINKGKEILI